MGTQVTLGTFVATFVFSVLTLGSVAHGAHGDFVPHLSITVAIGLVLVDLGVLIFFIHHVAKSIQLPEVIASIAQDLSKAIAEEVVASDRRSTTVEHEVGLSPTEFAGSDGRVGRHRGRDAAAAICGSSDTTNLVHIALSTDSVIRLLYRPGHFVVEGLPLATVWPPEAASAVAEGSSART